MLAIAMKRPRSETMPLQRYGFDDMSITGSLHVATVRHLVEMCFPFPLLVSWSLR